MASGCGCVQAVVPPRLQSSLWQVLPEVMQLEDGVIPERLDAVLFGPGLGESTHWWNQWSEQMLSAVLESISRHERAFEGVVISHCPLNELDPLFSNGQGASDYDDNSPLWGGMKVVDAPHGHLLEEGRPFKAPSLGAHGLVSPHGFYRIRRDIRG